VTGVSRFRVEAAAESSWLSRHRTESTVIGLLFLFLGAIAWHQNQAGPGAQDVAEALRRYASHVQTVDGMRTGSLLTEMQASLFAPQLRAVEITDRRRYPGYWSIDAVMRVEPPLGLPVTVPVRLRLARERDIWRLIDARDLSGKELRYKGHMSRISG
jgi:hypothetical protein